MTRRGEKCSQHQVNQRQIIIQNLSQKPFPRRPPRRLPVGKVYTSGVLTMFGEESRPKKGLQGRQAAARRPAPPPWEPKAPMGLYTNLSRETYTTPGPEACSGAGGLLDGVVYPSGVLTSPKKFAYPRSAFELFHILRRRPGELLLRLHATRAPHRGRPIAGAAQSPS